MKFPVYLTLLAVTLCAGLSRADEFSDVLAANKAKWEARQPDHYTYRYLRSCFCQPLEWQIEVEDGAVKDIKLVSVLLPGSSIPSVPVNMDIDSVFEWIRKAKAENPALLKVTYDAEFGFPTYISYIYRNNLPDGNSSTLITHFNVIPRGVTLSRDTIFTRNWPGYVDSQNSVRLNNTGDEPLYLNKIEMAVSPTDTFPNFGAALMFNINLPGNVGNLGRTYLRNSGPAGTDTIAELSGALMPPGGSLLLSGFQFDPCFCLVKAAPRITDGDSLTLLLRLDFSRGVVANRVDVRAYLYVRTRYGFTSGITRRPARRAEGGTGGPDRPIGRFPAGNRVYDVDGRSFAPILESVGR